MRTAESMTIEEKEQISKFIDFYSEKNIELFSRVFTEKRKAIQEEDYYQAYNRIITKIAKLFKEIGTMDPLTSSAVFEYMMWNGYFSDNHSLIYSESGRINNIVIPGADVIRGKSVCLNNASMETDVLRKMNFDAHIIGCKINPKAELNLEYKPNIERQIVHNKSILGKIISFIGAITPLKRIGNHAVTLIRTEDQYIVSDPTSLAYCNITDFLSISFVGSEVKAELKPLLTLVLEEISKEELEDIAVGSFVTSDNPLLTSKVVKAVYDNGIYVCKRNESLLDDFHTEIQPDIDIISKKLTKKINKNNK